MSSSRYNEFSICVLDIPLRVEYLPDGLSSSSRFIGGGHSIGVLKAAIESSPNAQQLHTTFVGIVGDDEAGEILQECIKGFVSSHWIEIQEDIRTLSKETIVDRSRFYSSVLLQGGKLRDMVAGNKCIFFPGTFLSVFEGIDVLLQLMYDLSEQVNVHGDNKCIAMSLGGPEIIHDHEDKLDAIMPFIDILFGTEEEAREYAQVYFGNEDKPIREVAAHIVSIGRIANLRPRIVVFTMADGGCMVATVGKIFQVPPNISFSTTLEAQIPWEERQFPRSSNLSGISTTVVGTNSNADRIDSFIGGFLAVLLSIEAQFDYTRSLCGPRATVSKAASKSPSLLTTAQAKATTKSKLKVKKCGIIDPNRSWSKQEMAKFYHTCIFPKERVEVSEVDRGGTEEKADSRQCRSSTVITGVKSLTECVVAGQLAQCHANGVSSFNFNESFYGADLMQTRSTHNSRPLVTTFGLSSGFEPL